jgi:mono/diheme cytochrome c family protein
MNNLKVVFLISVSLVLFLSFIPLNISKNNETFKMEQIQQDSIKWIAPDTANKLINPFETNDENIAKGQPIYKKLCRSCHGRLGDGQGVEAEDLESVTTDFTNPSFLEQTDGSMFWKISEGRDDMESFKEKLKEEDIWLVVLYIKTFSAVSKE